MNVPILEGLARDGLIAQLDAHALPQDGLVDVLDDPLLRDRNDVLEVLVAPCRVALPCLPHEVHAMLLAMFALELIELLHPLRDPDFRLYGRYELVRVRVMRGRSC